MQAESSLWGRKRVVGSKLKHDGTLGYISRGAARRSGLNPAGWHRYVPIAVVVAVIVIALAALGYAGGSLHHRRRSKGRGRTGRRRRNDPHERNDDNSIGKISCEWGG